MVRAGELEDPFLVSLVSLAVLKKKGEEEEAGRRIKRLGGMDAMLAALD